LVLQLPVVEHRIIKPRACLWERLRPVPDKPHDDDDDDVFCGLI